MNRLQPQTISKCFVKAGFNTLCTLCTTTDEASESLATIAQLLDQNNINVTAEDYVQIYEALVTNANIESAVDLIVEKEEGSDNEDGKDDDIGDGEKVEDQITNAHQALSAAGDLVRFATTSNYSDLLSLVYEVKNNLKSKIAAEKTRQMTLNEFETFSGHEGLSKHPNYPPCI